jgi:hypothetical protein
MMSISSNYDSSWSSALHSDTYLVRRFPIIPPLLATGMTSSYYCARSSISSNGSDYGTSRRTLGPTMVVLFLLVLLLLVLILLLRLLLLVLFLLVLLLLVLFLLLGLRPCTLRLR